MKEKNPKYRTLIQKWDKLRISIRALLPLFLLFSFGLMVGSAAALPSDRTFESFYLKWDPALQEEEINILNKSKGYVAYIDAEGLDFEYDKVVSEAFFIEFIKNQKILDYTLISNQKTGIEIGSVFGELIYSSDKLPDTLAKYITITKSGSTTLINDLVSAQGSEGYIYFIDEITNEYIMLDRRTFRIRSGVSVRDAINYIKQQPEVQHPTYGDLANYTRSNNVIENFDAVDFSTILPNSEVYQASAISTILLAQGSWEKHQKDRNIYISLISIGTIFLVGGLSYLWYIFFYVKKKKEEKENEET